MYGILYVSLSGFWPLSHSSFLYSVKNYALQSSLQYSVGWCLGRGETFCPPIPIRPSACMLSCLDAGILHLVQLKETISQTYLSLPAKNQPTKSHTEEILMLLSFLTLILVKNVGDIDWWLGGLFWTVFSLGLFFFRAGVLHKVPAATRDPEKRSFFKKIQ